jgi:hypothetical protein
MVEEGQPDPEFEAILGKINVMCFGAFLDIKYKASTIVATGIFDYQCVDCVVARGYLHPVTPEAFDSRLICFGFCGGQNGTRTAFSYSTSFFLCHCHSSNASYSFFHQHC